MNICIESQILNHPVRSGVMTYTEGLVKSLFANDRENDYALAYYSLRQSSQDVPGPVGRNFRKSVIRVPDREFFGRRFVIDAVALPLFLKKNKIQVFHRPVGYTMPELKDVFKILTVHDLRTLTIGDRKWSQNIGKYRKTLSGLDVCVVVSECTKQDLLKHFQMDERKIKVVHLAADERYRPALPSEVSAAQMKFGLAEPYFLSVGSVPRKNIEGIIRGFAASQSKKDFLLALNCRNDVDNYKKMAEGLGIGQRVVFLKHLSDEDLVTLYTGCHCFLFPSLYEGFGLPILEAMQCGAPVITSDISSCPEVAGDAAILVNPNETAEIGAAIDQFGRNEQLRKEFIKRGFERSKAFSWDQFARKMSSIYSLAK